MTDNLVHTFRFETPNFGEIPNFIARNAARGMPLARRLSLSPSVPGVCICAPGPTLLRNLHRLRKKCKAGWQVWAIKEAAQLLAERDIPVHGGVAIDPGPDQHLKTPVLPSMGFYLASSCSPSLFDYVDRHGSQITIFHSATGWFGTLVNPQTAQPVAVTELNFYKELYGCADVMVGGFTVVNRAISLASYLGTSDVEVFGATFGWREGWSYYAEGTKGRAGNEGFDFPVSLPSGVRWWSRPDLIASALHLVLHIRARKVEIVGESLAKILAGLTDNQLTQAFPGQWPLSWPMQLRQVVGLPRESLKGDSTPASELSLPPLFLIP